VLPLRVEEGIANGVPEVRKAVRYQIKYGVGVIKISASGGVMSHSGLAGAQQYSDEEIEAIVDEAHRAGIKVAAHAHGDAGIRACIRAGVDCIEHGSLASDETIKLMVEHGTFLVPTSYLSEGLQAHLEKADPALRKKAEEVLPQARVMLGKAIAAGVKIACGTDAPAIPHGQNAKELWAMVDRGMTPMQALRAATVMSAELIDVDRPRPARAGPARRHHRGAGRSVAGHHDDPGRPVRDEGRPRLQERLTHTDCPGRAAADSLACQSIALAGRMIFRSGPRAGGNTSCGCSGRSSAAWFAPPATALGPSANKSSPPGPRVGRPRESRSDPTARVNAPSRVSTRGRRMAGPGADDLFAEARRAGRGRREPNQWTSARATRGSYFHPRAGRSEKSSARPGQPGWAAQRISQSGPTVVAGSRPASRAECRRIYRRRAGRFQLGDVALRDRSAHHEHHVVGARRAQRIRGLLRVSATCDPERMLSPTIRTSSWTATDAIASGRCRIRGRSPRTRRRAAHARRASRRGRARRARAWRRAPVRASEHRRLLELAPLLLQHVDHLADSAVARRALDQAAIRLTSSLAAPGQLRERCAHVGRRARALHLGEPLELTRPPFSSSS
jgi:hypothetical protein